MAVEAPAGAPVRVEGVSCLYGGLAALDGVAFDIPAGTICGLIGPNGAGKTTLINVMSGLTPPSSGRVLFGDRVITGLPPHRIAALGIGRTFQNIRLFGDLSVLENVLLGYHLRQRGALLEAVLRLPRSRREERAAREAAHELLRRLRLDHLVDVEAGTLAYGDQRRVEIARALALEPRVLLLDEPAAGMNRIETDQLADFLLELRASGLTMLVIEHDMDLIMRVSDTVVVLNFGRRIAEGPPAAIRDNPAVIAAYLGEEEEGMDLTSQPHPQAGTRRRGEGAGGRG